MNPPRFIMQCWVVRPANGTHEFLQLRRAAGEYMGGAWQPVSGKIESNETAWQAAVREMREETSLKPLELYALDRVTSFYVPADDAVWQSIPFCAIVPADAIPRLNDEHDALRWVPRSQIESQVLWPSDRETVMRLCTEILDEGSAKSFLRIKMA